MISAGPVITAGDGKLVKLYSKEDSMGMRYAKFRKNYFTVKFMLL
jgi:hypothetical protein